jgi:hypothetical protein
VVFNIAFEAFGLRATIRNYLLYFVFLAVGFVFLLASQILIFGRGLTSASAFSFAMSFRFSRPRSSESSAFHSVSAASNSYLCSNARLARQRVQNFIEKVI